MKVLLPDIESQFPPSQIEEAMDMVRDTTEYDITEPEDGYFQVISTQPSFHVEIRLLPEHFAHAICHCAAYQKAKKCRHIIAGLILLRERRIRKPKKRAKHAEENTLLDETLRKLKTAPLKQFIKSYARSHTAFRAELLAHSLHLTRKPDYMGLLMELTPIDKRGQIKINRNNIKTLRGIISVLLKRAQQLLKDKALPETFQILEAILHHLQRLILKLPAFQSQLSTDYKLTLRIFETLSQQQMAPRLQDAVIRFTLELSSREGHLLIRGFPPLMRMAEPFVLEKKLQDAFFHVAEKKVISDIPQQLQWAAMMLRWMRLWGAKSPSRDAQAIIHHHIAEILLQASAQQDHDDVLFLLPLVSHEKLPKPLRRQCLHAGLRSARSLHHPEWISRLAGELSTEFMDPDAMEIVLRHDTAKAEEVLRKVSEAAIPGKDRPTDTFILSGWNELRQFDLMMEWLMAADDIELTKQYDLRLSATHKDQLVSLYTRQLRAIRDTYGGVHARQKLNNIFAHLRTVDLYHAVAEKLKIMDNKIPEPLPVVSRIKGFVFDLDGVIVDTAIHHFQSWKKLMREIGVVISDEDDHHTRGASRMESLEYLLTKYGVRASPEEKEQYAARKNSYYLEAIGQITPDDLLPGSLEFLMTSRESGLLLALGSASRNARGVLEKLGIEGRFDAILDGNDAVESKPHPEIFTKACAALELDPSTVVVFEDAAKGVQAAIAAGCHVVGIGDPSTLTEADIVIPDLGHATPEQIMEHFV